MEYLFAKGKPLRFRNYHITEAFYKVLFTYFLLFEWQSFSCWIRISWAWMVLEDSFENLANVGYVYDTNAYTECLLTLI